MNGFGRFIEFGKFGRLILLQDGAYGCTIVHMTFRQYRKSFRNLHTWQEAHKLTLFVYEVTRNFPSDERFAMVSQLRRAAYSIETQIAEGSCMPTPDHQKLYYDRAYASCAEVDNFLEIAHDLRYLTDTQYQELLDRINRVSFLLQKLSRSRKIKPTKLT